MKKRGFTLIELIVVIGIISLLSSIVLASLGNARAKARDARRLADMHNIRTALELYKSKYEMYPEEGSGDAGCGGFDAGYDEPNSDTEFIPGLVTDSLFGKTPGDPLSSSGCAGGYVYKYERSVVGSSGAHGCPKSLYVLAIKNLETWKDTENPYPSSPGFTCNGWDFQRSGGSPTGALQFDWMTGDLE